MRFDSRLDYRRSPCGIGSLEVVSRIFASWNQLSPCLRQLADLRLGRVDLIDGVPVVLSESARHSPGCV